MHDNCPECGSIRITRKGTIATCDGCSYTGPVKQFIIRPGPIDIGRRVEPAARPDELADSPPYDPWDDAWCNRRRAAR